MAKNPEYEPEDYTPEDNIPDDNEQDDGYFSRPEDIPARPGTSSIPTLEEERMQEVKGRRSQGEVRTSRCKAV